MACCISIFIFFATVVSAIGASVDFNRSAAMPLRNDRSSSETPFEQFGNVLKRYPEFLPNNSASLSAPCSKDLLRLRQEIGKKLWTVQMMDSIGVMPSGLLLNNDKWLGNFQQCLDVRSGDVTENEAKTKVVGKYCLAKFAVNISSSVEELQRKHSFTVGICAPSSCSARDVQITFDQVFQAAGVKAASRIREKYCQIGETTTLDAAAVSMIVILVVFVIILIAGTFLEFFEKEAKKECIPEKISTVAADSGARIGPMDSLRNMLISVSFCKSPAGILTKDILQCFSVRTNVKSLFEVKRTSSSIDALHGIRFFSMLWVILLHCYRRSDLYVWENFADFEKIRYNFLAEIIFNANIAVDTFFCLSGLLIAYVYLRKMKSNDGRIGIMYYYFHRYWRLTPIYAIVIGFVAGLFQLVGSGPNWPDFVDWSNNCRKNWWLNLLYLSNIVNVSEICQVHCWFLSCDMQLFLLSPLILIPMSRRPKIGVIITITVVLLSCVVNGFVTYFRHLGPNNYGLEESYGDRSRNNFGELYVKPYSRVGSYCVGMLTGYLLTNRKNEIKIRKVQQVIGWSLAIICNVTIAFGFYRLIAQKTEPSVVESVLYCSLSQPTWALGIAWLVTACATGHGGIINTFLSGSVFIPLSRLTYCAYIIHYSVVQIYFMSRKSGWFYDDWNAMYLFLGTLIFSYILSIPLAVTFEIPMIRLEKVVMDRIERGNVKELPTSIAIEQPNGGFVLGIQENVKPSELQK